MYSKKLAILKRIARLIRLKATGNCYEFADRLNTSKDTVYRLLELLKNDFKAPIVYNKQAKTYEYTRPGKLLLTFAPTPLSDDEMEGIAGGCGYKFSKNFADSLLLRIAGASFDTVLLPQNPGTGAIAY